MTDKWIDVKGPIMADTVYDSGVLVARDVSFTIPGLSFVTADIPAMGNMSVPLIGMLENMELTLTKVGVDLGLSRLSILEKHDLEFRWVQVVIGADGAQKNEGCKAFVRTLPPATLSSLVIEVGSATEAEVTYNVSRQQIYVGGTELLCVDRLAHVLRRNGKEYMNEINNLL